MKASIVGAIVTNTLFMLGASFLLGGLSTTCRSSTGRRASAVGTALSRHNRSADTFGGRQSGCGAGRRNHAKPCLGLAVLLIVGYDLGLLFTLRTHRDVFSGAEHAETCEAPWPVEVALATLAGVTVLVALVSEIFVVPPRWPRRFPARARTGLT